MPANSPAANSANQNGQSGVATSTNNNGNQVPGATSTGATNDNNGVRITNPQNPTQSAVAAEQSKAVTGNNTAPSSAGAVSAPGVGVGHSANGLPIGSPGSGPGSPEQPIGGK